MTEQDIIQFDKRVLDAYRKVDWQKVIARSFMVEGPLPKNVDGIHDSITTWCGVRIAVSRSFVELLKGSVLSFSLKDEENPLAVAAGKAIHVVDVLWRALAILRPKTIRSTGSERSLQATIIKYMCLALDGDIYKFLKYHTHALFSKYEKDEYGESQEDPPSFGNDRPGTLFVGMLQRCLIQTISDRKDGRKLKRSRLARFTVSQGLKKGFPQMEMKDVINAFTGGAKDLTTIKTVPQDLLREIQRTVREVIPNGLDDSFLDETDHFATLSTHSCTESGRSSGGALGAIRAKYGKTRMLQLHSWDSFLVRISYHPVLGSWEDRVPMWGPAEDGLCGFRTEAIKRIFNSPAPELLRGETVVSRKPAKQAGRTTCQLDEMEIGHREFHREVVFKGIIEPLKVRPITVASMDVNALWQPIQRQMWTAMQRFPCFALTGRPVCEEDVTKIWKGSMDLADTFSNDSRLNSNMKRILKFNSADYRSATNVLAMSASLAAAEAACPNPVLQMVMRNGLCGNFMTYWDPETKHFAALGVQTNGQLMGSVFSFPLLCLINAAIVRYSFEQIYNRPLRLDEIPFLINGDDMLCMLPPFGFDLWKDLTSAVGLEPSPGKNYFSREFAMINSKIFDVSSSGVVEERPFVNFSFITGVRKGGERGGPKDGEELEDDFFKVTKTFEQSAAFHAKLPTSIQSRVEEAVWDCQLPKWKALGLSTTETGFNLTFNKDLQPDNRVDYLLATLSLGHYRPKNKIPAYRYDQGKDIVSTWRYQTSMSRSQGDSDCRFVRRVINKKTHTRSQKFIGVITNLEKLTPGQRAIRVKAVRLGTLLRSGREDHFRNSRTRSRFLLPTTERTLGPTDEHYGR